MASSRRPALELFIGAAKLSKGTGVKETEEMLG